MNVTFTKKFLSYCRSAGKKRNLALEEKKAREAKEQEKGTKRKAELNLLKEMENRRALLNLERETLDEEILELKRKHIME